MRRRTGSSFAGGSVDWDPRHRHQRSTAGRIALVVLVLGAFATFGQLSGSAKNGNNVVTMRQARQRVERNVDVVVSRCDEDIGPLMDVVMPHKRRRRVYVYEKCGDTPAGQRVKGVKYLPLPNVGREGHTYLHHIVNFDHTADYTAFIQGAPFTHIFPGLKLDSYLEVNETMPYYYPISGQLLLLKGTQMHRVRDGFQSLHYCHAGTLNPAFDWETLNRQRHYNITRAVGLWGDEDAFGWNRTDCSVDVGPVARGPWTCNWVPLMMPWNVLYNLTVSESIQNTWDTVFLNSVPMPRLLHYNLGAQFTLSKRTMTNPDLMMRYAIALKLLENDVKPVEVFHMELFWGYIFNLESLTTAPRDIPRPFECSSSTA